MGVLTKTEPYKTIFRCCTEVVCLHLGSQHPSWPLALSGSTILLGSVKAPDQPCCARHWLVPPLYAAVYATREGDNLPSTGSLIGQACALLAQATRKAAISSGMK